MLKVNDNISRSATTPGILQPALATSTCPACCDAHSESELGHELPRQLTGGAAAAHLKADSKVSERRGGLGPQADIAR
jgi:hypothetical protein